jgi:hypothetical protein
VAMPSTKEKEKSFLSFLCGFFGKENLAHKNITFSENYVGLG